MPRSLPGSLAQESGGGGRAFLPSSVPAIHTTSVVLPRASVAVMRGMSSCQNMVKWGSAILCLAGRFTQIWNSSVGLGASVCKSGNISQCTMPLPAVSHCTSPPPKRAVAPSESEWSMRPLRTMVTVSNPRCGCDGKPGTVSPWYMLQPSLPAKSWPMLRPASSAGLGAICALPAG